MFSPVERNPSINDSLSHTLKQSRSEEAPRGISAGRNVTVCDKNESLFLSLPRIPTLMIIGHLNFREVTGLAMVCKHFHTFIKTNKTVERA